MLNIRLFLFNANLTFQYKKIFNLCRIVLQALHTSYAIDIHVQIAIWKCLYVFPS